jgi:hypothetical protein
MRRAGAVLEAARDITVRGESPAHRPSGRPRTSSRARPPGGRPGAGWPERPMPRRGQSWPGLVRVGIARNARHRHLLARHSGAGMTLAVTGAAGFVALAHCAVIKPIW